MQYAQDKPSKPAPAAKKAAPPKGKPASVKKGKKKVEESDEDDSVLDLDGESEEDSDEDFEDDSDSDIQEVVVKKGKQAAKPPARCGPLLSSKRQGGACGYAVGGLGVLGCGSIALGNVPVCCCTVMCFETTCYGKCHCIAQAADDIFKGKKGKGSSGCALVVLSAVCLRVSSPEGLYWIIAVPSRGVTVPDIKLMLLRLYANPPVFLCLVGNVYPGLPQPTAWCNSWESLCFATLSHMKE